MPLPTEITVAQLTRLVGTPDAPVLIDVRTPEDFAADPRLLPASQRRDHAACPDWGGALAGQRAIVICQKGHKLSQGVAAWLRHLGAQADTLEGGFEGWRAAGAPLVSLSHAPAPDAEGRTRWVTRARPKIDRIACPWLIRRFVDPRAVFLFVGASEVSAVGTRFEATPFDIEAVFWSHRGAVDSPGHTPALEHTCTFDTMIHEFSLETPALMRLATIVRAADTDQLDLAPQAAGLLAVSVGLSRMFSDDLAQLEAGLLLYDALYRWCRDGQGETHNWPNPGKKA
jgi:rhodanese-related sulfurtransferase